MTQKRVPFFAMGGAILIVALDRDVRAASAPALEIIGDDEGDGTRRDAENRGKLVDCRDAAKHSGGVVPGGTLGPARGIAGVMRRYGS